MRHGVFTWFCDHILFGAVKTARNFRKDAQMEQNWGGKTKHYSDSHEFLWMLPVSENHHHQYHDHPLWSIQLYWALLVVGWPALVPACHVGPCCFETPDCTRPDLIAVAFVVCSADTLSNDQWNQSHTLRDDLTWQGNIFFNSRSYSDLILDYQSVPLFPTWKGF